MKGFVSPAMSLSGVTFINVEHLMTTLTGLFADHLKKGRDTSQTSAEPAPSVDSEPVAARKSR